MKKILVLLGLFFTARSYARGTPFDSFIGNYRVVGSKCNDLFGNREVETTIKQVRILDTGNDEEIRIISAGGWYRHDFIYTNSPAYFNSHFSGDGVSNASWSQGIESLDYRYEVSISNVSGKLVFNWLDRFLGGSSTVHSHVFCEYELEKL